MPLFAMAETEEIKFRVASLGFDIIQNFSVAHKKRKFNFSLLDCGEDLLPATSQSRLPLRKEDHPREERGP